MKNLIKKIVNSKLNFIFYFFWTTLRIKFLVRRPLYEIGLLLYYLNYFFLKTKNSFKKIPNLPNNNYQLSEIIIESDFIKKISNILSKPNQIKFDKNKHGYVYYDKYNTSYLDQVVIQSNVDRKYFIDFLEKRYGDNIRKIYGNNSYRVEHFWLIKTLNKNKRETYNLNSKYHTDPCMPGALKIIIYLCDVDEENGPFAIKDKNSNIKFITGKTGTTIIFDPNKCLHAGSNTKTKDRVAISYLIYPSVRKKFKILDEKPFLADFTLNPFTNKI